MSKFEFTNCPICGGNEYKYLHSSKDLVNFIEGIYSIVQCTDCGQIRTQPRPIYTDLSSFYPDTYSPYNNADNLKNSDLKSLNFSSYSLMWLNNLFFANDRALPLIDREKIEILDYGCGDGSFLKNLDQNKYSCYGIDFSDLAVKRANLDSIVVYKEPVSQDQFQQSYFQIITAWMVLEHTYDPLAALRKLRFWLKDEGYLVISVPDFHSLHRILLPYYSYDNHVPNHTLHFTRKTIVSILEKSGFKVVDIKWQRNSRSLKMTLRNFIFCNYSNTVLVAYDNFCNSFIGKGVFKLLAFFLGVTSLSGRMVITAVIDS